MEKTSDNRLVQCPHVSDVHYFAWHCREQKARGVETCARCEAMDKQQSLQTVMDQVKS